MSRAARTLAFAAAAPMLAAAQQLSFSVGATHSDRPVGDGAGWSVRYAHDLDGPLFATALYLNEGHIPGHHRDGAAVQLGLRAANDAGAALSLAAGPYRYFDTEEARSPSGFSDAHGWAALYSLALDWPGARRGWVYQLRVDRVESPSHPDTTTILAGIGIQTGQDPSFGAEPPRRKGGRDEVVAYLGQTVVNSFRSESSTARSIELRHDFGPVVRGSLAWLNEGDARLIRRNGVLAQAWLEPTFHDGRASLGIGIGGYFAVDAYRPEQRHDMVMLSATASARIARGWTARLTWHRSASNYDRDSDVFLLGLGYRF